MIESYYQRNREKRIAYATEYRKKQPVEKVRAYVRDQVKRWRAENKDRAREIERNSRKTYKEKTKFSPQHRLSDKISRAIRSITFYRVGKKRVHVPFVMAATTLSREQLKIHFDLSSGRTIDHIVPLCAFDLTDPIQLLKANHVSNLRAVEASENFSKGAKTPEFDMASLPFNTSAEAHARAVLFIQPVLDYCKKQNERT